MTCAPLARVLRTRQGLGVAVAAFRPFVVVEAGHLFVQNCQDDHASRHVVTAGLFMRCLLSRSMGRVMWQYERLFSMQVGVQFQKLQLENTVSAHEFSARSHSAVAQ